jgi:cyclophilin family peptidyl-prolyl cis-trans isomerase
MAQYLDLDGLKTLVTNINNKFIKKGEIDNTFVEVLTDISKLPTTNIGKHIYLVPEPAASGVAKNRYAEYVYTGILPIVVDETAHTSNYDATKWEKLGDFQAEVDLTAYSKKADTVNGVAAGNNDASNIKINVTKNSAISSISIPSATTSAAGAMSAADKAILTKLANRYPFDISWISVKPDVAELGTDNVVNLSWNFSNEDFHRVTSQKVAGTGAYTGSATPAVGTKTQSFSIPKENVTSGTDRKVVTFTLTAIADSTTKTKTCTVTFVHASYCGVVDANKASLTAAEIIKLGNKAVINSKNRTVSITQSNQKLVYAYPAYFGDLTSIKDGNGFQGFSGYSKLTAVTVNGTNYNVYMQKTPATATGSYTFA